MQFSVRSVLATSALVFLVARSPVAFADESSYVAALPDSMKCLASDACQSATERDCVQDCLGISYDQFSQCDSSCFTSESESKDVPIEQTPEFTCFTGCVVSAQNGSAVGSNSTSTTTASTAGAATSSHAASATSAKASATGTKSVSASNSSDSSDDDSTSGATTLAASVVSALSMVALIAAL
ncbi:hypothetical protein H4R33_001621 [Dimargaris cristalligena]|uniref:Extracellular membrane protein CFEM domain-containing protein n=1 Tax=Dimargaris cristalligena TaxID=215637 RepID=A0A4P9ZVK4_9FUNG|nr:hypothetical protein H4R33_001621 [Dimargaris cristalligena]RKP37625.1 hypothetical protein BJ085DRAFT_38214 [Dimargaris cristalligena]|eukprot:RKP37625.1 hypothetical protein BJ085DRAFT_38214 [Dimargaris cristalligena]